MAEGLLRARFGDHYKVFSAGTEPSGVSPFAVEVMAEAGIDISHHRSESVDTYTDHKLDYVVTVCDAARGQCPYLPARQQNFHCSFEDPSAVEESDEAKRAAFRRIRDEIATWIETTFDPGKKH